MNTSPNLSRHPCFNEEVKGVCGRVHLPVAPRCNIQCNYCDRRYDCVNESRPGVTSAVLTPHQAALYLDGVLAAEPRISVVGIAGPGDPLANPEETFGTLAAIRRTYPELLFCLSTNGLALPAHAEALARHQVTHVTVTVNAVDPAVGERVYAWARDGKVIYRGRQAAELLWARQREGILALKRKGVLVKVNTILIPGINETHVEAVARTVSELGVDVLNVMAMVPNPGTPFGGLAEPSAEQVAAARAAAGVHLPQMKHCQRCRADAVGLVCEDRSAEFAERLAACARVLPLDETRPHVAVATREGVLVNAHLGEADMFQVWTRDADGFRLAEERAAPARGGGVERWRELAHLLGDCRAVLVSGFGKVPEAILRDEGLVPVEMSGFIEFGLRAVYEGRDLTAYRRRAAGCAKGLGCGGDGGGCG